jgi:hypothetical protein
MKVRAVVQRRSRPLAWLFSIAIFLLRHGDGTRRPECLRWRPLRAWSFAAFG